MKRRDFFRISSTGIVASSVIPAVMGAGLPQEDLADRKNDKWLQVANGRMAIPVRKKELHFDVVVVGGGMAGISAAVASARNGAKTILIQDRPVLGGNASSEMRVTVNGAQPERETGILEEILIENWVHNQQESYPVWDHVLYNFVQREKNLTVMLNTQAVDVIMDENIIKAAVCWGISTETEFTIYSKQFVDCSGDGLLAAKAGAEYRTGREGKAEFDESYAPDQADGWVMGECIMMITRDLGRPAPFIAPDYAIPFDYETAFKDKHRQFKQFKEGFWWIEVGSNFDIIAEREEIRHQLMAHFYGVWDFIKNSGKYPEAENLVLDWVGSIPGRRESRRFMGDHILSQKDLMEYRHYDDAVAFGGWSLDEHNPGGIENLSEPASYFHENFEKIYEIPYRSLYSRNIANLSFAGRNASVTHIALSSTRIIGTCAMMGQAAGTGAALCARRSVNPRRLATDYIDELQEQLLRDDSYFPNRPAADENDLARMAAVIFASSTLSGDAKALVDGVARDVAGEVHHWESDGLNTTLHLEWEKPIQLSKVEMKGDTNLKRKLMMHKNPSHNEEQILGVPPELIKAARIEVRKGGDWVEVAKVENNITRLIKTSFDPVNTTAVRMTFIDTWGHPTVKLFELRCYS